MDSNYQGEKILSSLKGTKFQDWTVSDWAVFWMEVNGPYDGANSKDWLIDQAVRILKGTSVIVSFASWKNGDVEFRFRLDLPSDAYLEFVKSYEENGKEWCVGVPS